MPPRPTLAAAAVAVSLLACPRAFGWVFDEHTELGSKGYRDACADLARDLHLDVQPKPAPAGAPAAPDPCVTPANDTTARWCLACRLFPPVLYGQSVAIAGDHVGTPEELMSSNGQVVAASVRNYASLALENVTHFHPGGAPELADVPRPGAGARDGGFPATDPPRATSHRSSTRRPSRITFCRTRSRRGTPALTGSLRVLSRRRFFTTSGTRPAGS